MPTLTNRVTYLMEIPKYYYANMEKSATDYFKEITPFARIVELLPKICFFHNLSSKLKPRKPVPYFEYNFVLRSAHLLREFDKTTIPRIL